MPQPNYISPHFQKVHYPSSSIRDFRAAEGLNGGQVGEPVELVNVTEMEYKYKYNDFRVKDFEKVFGEETERSSMVKDRNKGIGSVLNYNLSRIYFCFL